MLLIDKEIFQTCLSGVNHVHSLGSNFVKFRKNVFSNFIFITFSKANIDSRTCTFPHMLMYGML